MKNINNTNTALRSTRPQPGKSLRTTALLGAAAAGILLTTQPTLADNKTVPAIGNIFVIAMENHNFTQPNPISNPQQILGNPAAPFLNSLITPGNPNAAQVSYATAYFNAGIGVHPSEPNYLWAEAGSDFGVHTDADPIPAVAILSTTTSLTSPPSLTRPAFRGRITRNTFNSASAPPTAPREPTPPPQIPTTARSNTTMP